jgi:hypothetical protein
MSSLGIALTPHVRGDTFVYSTTLEGGWVAEDFSGGLKFTLRERAAASSVVTDTDAVDQASVAGGEIEATGTSVTITIPASRSTTWPVKGLLFDLQGVVTGTPNRVYTIASGTIVILRDMTRST